MMLPALSLALWALLGLTGKALGDEDSNQVSITVESLTDKSGGDAWEDVHEGFVLDVEEGIAVVIENTAESTSSAAQDRLALTEDSVAAEGIEMDDCHGDCDLKKKKRKKSMPDDRQSDDDGHEHGYELLYEQQFEKRWQGEARTEQDSNENENREEVWPASDEAVTTTHNEEVVPAEDNHRMQLSFDVKGLLESLRQGQHIKGDYGDIRKDQALSDNDKQTSRDGRDVGEDEDFGERNDVKERVDVPESDGFRERDVIEEINDVGTRNDIGVRDDDDIRKDQALSENGKHTSRNGRDVGEDDVGEKDDVWEKNAIQASDDIGDRDDVDERDDVGERDDIGERGDVREREDFEVKDDFGESDAGDGEDSKIRADVGESDDFGERDVGYGDVRESDDFGESDDAGESDDFEDKRGEWPKPLETNAANSFMFQIMTESGSLPNTVAVESPDESVTADASPAQDTGSPAESHSNEYGLREDSASDAHLSATGLADENLSTESAHDRYERSMYGQLVDSTETIVPGHFNSRHENVDLMEKEHQARTGEVEEKLVYKEADAHAAATQNNALEEPEKASTAEHNKHSPAAGDVDLQHGSPIDTDLWYESHTHENQDSHAEHVGDLANIPESLIKPTVQPIGDTDFISGTGAGSAADSGHIETQPGLDPDKQETFGVSEIAGHLSEMGVKDLLSVLKHMATTPTGALHLGLATSLSLLLPLLPYWFLSRSRHQQAKNQSTKEIDLLQKLDKAQTEAEKVKEMAKQSDCNVMELTQALRETEERLQSLLHVNAEAETLKKQVDALTEANQELQEVASQAQAMANDDLVAQRLLEENDAMQRETQAGKEQLARQSTKVAELRNSLTLAAQSAAMMRKEASEWEALAKNAEAELELSKAAAAQERIELAAKIAAIKVDEERQRIEDGEENSTELAKWEEQCAVLRQLAQDVAASQNALERQNAASSARVKELQAELDTQYAAAMAAKEVADERENELQNVQKRAETVKQYFYGELSSLKERIATVTLDRDVARLHQRSHQEQLARLQAKLDHGEAERSELRQRMLNLTAERDSFAQRVATVQAEKEHMAQSLGALHNDNTKLSESLTAAETDRDNLAAALGRLQASNKNLTTRITAMERAHNAQQPRRPVTPQPTNRPMAAQQQPTLSGAMLGSTQALPVRPLQPRGAASFNRAPLSAEQRASWAMKSQQGLSRPRSPGGSMQLHSDSHLLQRDPLAAAMTIDRRPSQSSAHGTTMPTLASHQVGDGKQSFAPTSSGDSASHFAAPPDGGEAAAHAPMYYNPAMFKDRKPALSLPTAPAEPQSHSAPPAEEDEDDLGLYNKKPKPKPSQ